MTDGDARSLVEVPENCADAEVTTAGFEPPTGVV